MSNGTGSLVISLFLQINIAQILVIAFAIAIPFIILIITGVYIQRIKKIKKVADHALASLEDELGEIYSLKIENAAEVERIFAEQNQTKLSQAWARLSKDSKDRYNSRWFPPLETELDPDLLADDKEYTVLSLRPATLVSSIGALAAVFLFIYLKSLPSQFYPGLALIPLAIGSISGLLLYNASMEARVLRQVRANRLYASLTRIVPVYNNHNGVALLVDEMLSHESRLAKSVDEFNTSASKMADSDFAQGISSAVREIMSQEIAPPIAQASDALTDLAHNLDRRQLTGMENLASQFSTQLNQDLGIYLQPLHTELAGLNRLMGRTKDFVEASIQVLNTSREQNIVLNQEIGESLKIMTMAKNDLANEMAAISDDIDILSKTSDKMARSFAGEEDALSDRIRDLSQTVQDALQVFSVGLNNVSSSLKLAGDLKLEQGQQHEEITIQLSKLIANLEELDTSLRNSTNNFTQESSTYVNKTLQSFDEGLAEVVERLVFTATSLRDAVDSLPQALKQINSRDV